MARNTDVLIRVVGVNDTDAATNAAIENVEAVGRATSRTSREAKKDWGGVSDLFSSVLPRGLQRTMRQFKSTTRSVGRLSKSFKVLKAAWAGIGIGLAIIALEKIIENWDKITEALGFYNKEAEETKRLNLKIAESQGRLTSEMQGYLSVIKKVSSTEEERVGAVNALNRQLGKYIDTEADAITQQKQALALSELALEMDKQAILVSEQKEKVAKLETTAASKDLFFAIPAQNKLHKQRKILQELTTTQLGLEGKLSQLLLERSDAEKARLEAEKIAAKVRADLAKQAQADADYLADLEKRISEEIMLAKIEDEQKRAEEELKLRTKEQVMKALAAGATAEQLLLIEEKYLLDLADLREGFKEDDPNAKTPEQIAQEQQALQDEMFLILMSEQDREETLLMQKYDRRIELANGNRELELEAEKIFLDEMEALTEDSEAKIQSIKEAGIKATVNAARGLFSVMGKMAEDGSEQAKALAITDVLLAQAVSLANGIKVASKAAKDPFTLVAGIITAISAVMGAFVGVKAILNEAGASAGGGGGGVPSTTPLVPDQVSRTETTGKTFVVQSDLEGAALQANQLYSQTALGGG
jgi:uncharacterized protein YdbL (DUF1318 family)